MDTSANPLRTANLVELMQVTRGHSTIAIGLIDGALLTSHPDFRDSNIRQCGTSSNGTCSRVDSAACQHGTFIASILCARRGSVASGICPGCTLLARPIFRDGAGHDVYLPSATPHELSEAIEECIDCGARVINLSVGLDQHSTRGQDGLHEAFDHAARRGVIVVAAAGNQAMMGGSLITRHPWVIPVTACDQYGQPINIANLGSAIGRNGLRAQGDDIVGLGTDGKPFRMMGTSVAAPFVTGTIALLWSIFPSVSASAIRNAVLHPNGHRRTTVVPPLLDARLAYRYLSTFHSTKEDNSAWGMPN